MTRQDGTDKVSLSVGNWVGLILTLAVTVGTPIMILQGRLTTVEVNQTNMQTQINEQKKAATDTRSEILGEIRGLRHELKAK